MIIRNEKDRLKAWALLRDAELPCEVNIKKIELYYSREVDENGKQIVYPQYPDTPEPELGDHPSGMEAEEHW